MTKPKRLKPAKKQPTRRVSTLKPVPVAELQGLLRAAGLRSTGPRVAVLRFLQGSGTPASHADLYEAVSDAGFDRATLYRNLMDLAEAGIVSRTDLGDHVWRFELKRAGGNHTGEHPHFVCSDCGVVSCLPGVAIKIVPAFGAPRSIGGKEVEVQLKGLCDACG